MGGLGLFVLVTFLIALLLGRLTRARIRVLLLPPLGLALVSWVAAGASGGSYELDRTAVLLITGFAGACFVFVCLAGLVAGRLLQRDSDLSREMRSQSSAFVLHLAIGFAAVAVAFSSTALAELRPVFLFLVGVPWLAGFLAFYGLPRTSLAWALP